MIWFPILISLAALLVSGANFYITHFRKKRALYLVVVQRISRQILPGFAIINASSEDIIITEISYVFKMRSSSFRPAQVCEWEESDSLLIAKGKGIHARISFSESFTKPFVESGVLSPENPGVFEHDLFLDISWVQGDGEKISKSIHLLKVGLVPNGEMRSVSRLCEKIDLYRANDPSI